MNGNKKVDAEVIQALSAVIGDSERIHTGESIHQDYFHDELFTLSGNPDILVEPVNAEEVSAIVSYASANRIPITPRGEGTGLVGGGVSLHGGIMLSLQKMNSIIELDEENLILTLEPGVLLMEIAAFLETKKLFYPPDPGEKSATIGGNISTNAGGMRAVRYGVTRDFVRGLQVVLPSGEIVELGGKTAKNSSGYSLKDLMIGSEGTLGIITQAKLRILPLPAVTKSMLMPFPNLRKAITAVPKIMHASQIPTAVEFMQGEVIAAAVEYLGRPFPDTSADAYLLASYDGPSSEFVDAALEEVAETALDNGALDGLYVDTPERHEAVWKTRGTFLEAIKASTTEMDECDVVVPRDRIVEFLEYSHSLSEEFRVRIMSFGHAGDGNLHLYVLRDELDENTWEERLEIIFSRMYDKAHALGGQVSGEHGIGFAKKGFLKDSVGEVIFSIMSGIKSVFDPAGIMNPGKVI